MAGCNLAKRRCHGSFLATAERACSKSVAGKRSTTTALINCAGKAGARREENSWMAAGQSSKTAACPAPQGAPRSVPADAIDGTTAIHGRSRTHGLTCDSPRNRPRPEHDAGPHDTAGGILDVLAIDDCASSFRTCRNEACSQEQRREHHHKSRLHFFLPKRLR